MVIIADRIEIAGRPPYECIAGKGDTQPPHGLTVEQFVQGTVGTRDQDGGVERIETVDHLMGTGHHHAVALGQHGKTRQLAPATSTKHGGQHEERDQKGFQTFHPIGFYFFAVKVMGSINFTLTVLP